MILIATELLRWLLPKEQYMTWRRLSGEVIMKKISTCIVAMNNRQCTDNMSAHTWYHLMYKTRATYWQYNKYFFTIFSLTECSLQFSTSLHALTGFSVLTICNNDILHMFVCVYVLRMVNNVHYCSCVIVHVQQCMNFRNVQEFYLSSEFKTY